jgi:hypothetical protein
LVLVSIAFINWDCATQQEREGAAARKKRGGSDVGEAVFGQGSDSNPEGIAKITGPTSAHPSLSGSLLLAGGIVSRMPFDSRLNLSISGPIQEGQHGRWSSPAGCTIREVALYVQYEPLLDTSRRLATPSQDQTAKTPEGTKSWDKWEPSGIVGVLIEAPRGAGLVGSVLKIFSRAGGVDILSSAKEARRASPIYRKSEATIDGAMFWWILSPGWTSGSSTLEPNIFLAELYGEDPDTGAAPIDVAIVAKRAGAGAWQSVNGYLMRGERLMRATAILENGLPARVEGADVSEPPVEDFLVSKETSIRSGQLRTGVLLAAKNRTLPRILQDGKTTNLADLLTRIEKTILELSHERELVNNLAQQAIESGGNAGGLPELSLVYRERIEVLKPMATAVKDEIANRGK